MLHTYAYPRRINIPMQVHTRARTHTTVSMTMYMRTHTHAHSHTHRQTNIHTNKQTHPQPPCAQCTHTHKEHITFKPEGIHTYIHTHTHTRTHARTDGQTNKQTVNTADYHLLVQQLTTHDIKDSLLNASWPWYLLAMCLPSVQPELWRGSTANYR